MPTGLLSPVARGPVTRLPVTIVAGLAGAGKTALLRHWLARKPSSARWLVLQNAGAAIGPSEFEGAVIGRLPGGCACCVGRVAFEATLTRLLRGPAADRLLIELDAGADVAAFVDQLSSGTNAARLRIDDIVAVVDAKEWPRRPPARLLDPASRVILNRAGSCPADALACAAELLRGRAPFARVVQTSLDADVSSGDASSWNSRTDGFSTPPEYSVCSWRDLPAGGSARICRPAGAGATLLALRWPLERRFDRSALLRASDNWTSLPRLLRADGVLRTPRAWYRWQFDGKAATWTESGWRRDSRLELVLGGASAETGAEPASAGLASVELARRIEAALVAALRPD